MTLPSSGPLTSNQILAELDRPANSVLNSTDADLIELAGRNDFTIPDDLYGKSAIGSVLGTYTVNVGQSSGGTLFGYNGDIFGNPFGLLNGQNANYWFSNPNPPYRNETMSTILDVSATPSFATWNLSLQISGTNKPADFVTAVKVGSKIRRLEAVSSTQSSTIYYFGLVASQSAIWTASDVGKNRVVEVYGK